jgi:tetratricopeptide (TPR) repeat protein
MLRPLLIAAASLGLAAPLFAQSTEFNLSDSGEWVVLQAPAAGTDDATIGQTRSLLARGDARGAYRIIDDWIDANERTASPLLPEALRLRGDALTASGDEYEALYDYERVIREFSATPEYVTAVERELEIGMRYVRGLERKFFGVRVVPAEDIGEELLIRVQERMPGSRVAERAGIELADYYFADRDLEMAEEAYDLFMENYPQSSYSQKAMQRRVYATIAKFKGPRYDGAPLKDADILIDRFQDLYPAAARDAGLDEGLQTRIDESGAEQLMESASWYLQRGDDTAARYTLNRLLTRHPQTATAQRAMDFMRDRNWELPAPPERERPNEQPATTPPAAKNPPAPADPSAETKP